MPEIQVKAPAKINLHLNIGHRRPDGFHGIESLFLALAFGDTLRFETVADKMPDCNAAAEIDMDWQLPDQPPAIPLENNIIFRAISLFRSRTGYDEGLKVSVTKRIPPGGGLGGGSSDAAATLLALNRLAGAASGGKNPVNGAALAEMGAELGSDVPFFLNSVLSAAWVSGRGEHVQPFKLPQAARNLFFVLVYPGFPSDTATAYRLFDSRRQNCIHQPEIFFPRVSRESVLVSLKHSPRNWPFYNDFLKVFREAAGENPTYSEVFNSYRRIIVSLEELGAEFSGLSGSGSTCFGVFSDRAKAQAAKIFLLKEWDFVNFSFSLEKREA
jgi:4-diphosphocytidyl-2-C-methyl-D-erythritol kinase